MHLLFEIHETGISQQRPEESALHHWGPPARCPSGRDKRLALEVNNHLVPIPLKCGQRGAFKIFIHPDGKSHLPMEEVNIAKEAGHGIVLLDLYRTGETANPNNTAGKFHQFYRLLLWLGRSLMGEWYNDLRHVLRLLENHYQATDLELIGFRETGLCQC